jgi:transcription-repair coupling factor (superfamily II helicase)
MLSRFRTAKEKKDILERVEQGKVDILIGTHALLSKDLKFQDLGLLIVDEEQRFGVRHKERLKQMRAAIDVLSMSATPIPRTLHMSLVGLRDMSVIETPPKDRMAIQTIVAKFDEKLIRTALELELERGGQVYFVHNRVETIYEMAAKIRELVPQARVVVGHGQLPEAELERTMLAFMDGEYDVLCATSIIENGLDIPRANTIIINRADRHGLSELYQLRGRVGRSNRRAYAYLLIPPEQQLTEIARRRLAALKEFSDLGAGFKIAALDLELRGAGNMLGGEQSGHIEAIGFEMYTTMLEEAVSRLKGEGREERPQVTVNLGISLRIDETYIPEEGQRLRMYKRIAGAESMAALTEVRAELEDRYGKPPQSVLHLLSAGEIRLTCEMLGIVQIERKRTMIEEPKKAAPAPARPNVQRPGFGSWSTGQPQRAPLAGRYGQAPQTANLQFSTRAAASRPVTNATVALRETAAVRPANAPALQAGRMKPMREMLYVTFSEKLHAAPPRDGKGINVGALMNLVARNAKNGAQLTPQGTLRWPLSSAQADVVLTETRELLEMLRPKDDAAS